MAQHTQDTFFSRMLPWAGFAALLVIMPLAFPSSGSLSLFSQMGTAMVFGLSYNMLLGQGGMLSFGHAVYSGLGGFWAAHAMNYAGEGLIWLPLPFVPLAGGLAGMAFAVLIGYVTTRRSGTTFAMITLGLGQMVFACALMFPDFFGGEGGISTNRVYEPELLGLNFGPQLQVYGLIAAWLFLSTLGMYGFTQTPLGRIINAVRDNPERAAFIGYDTRWARYLTLIISGFFAGIAGALNAINFEIASADILSIAQSGTVLLFTYIGGIGNFVGPIVGAAIGVLMTVRLSDYSTAWHLYLGLLFIVVVMYLPGGVTSLAAPALRLMRHPHAARLALPGLCTLLTGIFSLTSLVMLIEMLYHRDSGADAPLSLFGLTIDISQSMPWIGAVVALAAGLLALRFGVQWCRGVLGGPGTGAVMDMNGDMA
ncbi:branched-chain amino acid ABC transporter permease [Bordetella petrii]|nr:branched-chain amino acid ABC transporter permease [Bordetella petrii]